MRVTVRSFNVYEFLNGKYTLHGGEIRATSPKDARSVVARIKRGKVRGKAVVCPNGISYKVVIERGF